MIYFVVSYGAVSYCRCASFLYLYWHAALISRVTRNTAFMKIVIVSAVDITRSWSLL